ncbi:MAG TPA: thioredoxin-disulfide reductase [Euryarchaeota archaeon]|nr:thioredoxin-disulfide reductase [Euryarchaeota archaeon]
MTVLYDLLIVGGGPASFAAAIYGGRAGLAVHIVDEGAGGGQMALSPLVENYPGYESIMGLELTEKMMAHAMNYSTMETGYHVDEIITKDGLFLARGGNKEWKTRAVLLATGAEHRKLNIPGEIEFYGKGVSYCATCDGFFFKDRDVLVIGGGDSALSEARYLLSIGARVTVAHRRDEFRGEKANQDAFFKDGGKVLWNSQAVAFLGDQGLTAVRLKNTKSKDESTFSVHGAFVAIGYNPKNELAKKMGLDLDDEGYIPVDIYQRTEINRVYAAGDITGGLKQVVTAVGQGAKAAMSVYNDIKKMG